VGKVYWVRCPQCEFDYYVGKELLDIEGFPTVCPRCHHEYPPRESAIGIRESA
jgi:hypothetical protein